MNGRIGNGLGDYAEARDNRIPDRLVDMDWEVPATINDTWGYKSYDQNWKPVEELIRKLVDIVSKGGNYLLNVGPTAEGIIPQPSVERLLAMGDWLRVNGESVYDTRPGPLQGLEWCRPTVSATDPSTLYVHIFDWPHDGLIRLAGLPRPAAGAYLLADPARTALPVMQQDGAVLIQGPARAPDPIDTVLVLKLA
ncbi:MAG: hypothetical protein C4345_13530 [Chloroflexota bacterium]